MSTVGKIILKVVLTIVAIWIFTQIWAFLFTAMNSAILKFVNLAALIVALVFIWKKWN